MPNARPRTPLAGPDRPGRDLSRPLPAALSWTVVIVFAAALAAAYATLALAWWIPALYGAASVVAFVAYALDKSAARRDAARVSERTLLLLGLVGGWPGALVAQQAFRHKTRKRSFRRAFWGTVVLNVLALAVYLVVVEAPLIS